MKPLVLIYGCAEPKLEKLLQCALEYNIDYKIVTEDDLSQKLGYLVGLEGYKKEVSDFKKDCPNCQFLLFNNFDGSLLNIFLKTLKERQLTVEYKAALTNTTKDWDLSYLIGHIKDEANTIKLYRHLGTMVKFLSDHMENVENREEAQSLIELAKNMPGSIDFNVPLIEDVISKFNKFFIEEKLL